MSFNRLEDVSTPWAVCCLRMKWKLFMGKLLTEEGEGLRILSSFIQKFLVIWPEGVSVLSLHPKSLLCGTGILASLAGVVVHAFKPRSPECRGR